MECGKFVSYTERKESMNRNTKTTILAQGDNQVICGKYKVQKTLNEVELTTAINGIIRENRNIMQAIETGTQRLGLIINRDETLQSADFLVYGKVPIYRGSIRGLETKRWSRVTCVTNDQLPTLANTMSSISSNALTVAHFSNSPLNCMIHYNFLGNLGRIILEIHNPAIKSQIKYKVKNPERLLLREYKALVLYLDPCLGGACGMSLTRFLIRGFPDPLTESLPFWVIVHNNGPAWLKKLSIQVGAPKFSQLTTEAFKKLLEDPSCLNISGGINPLSMIKDEIKQSLINNSGKIKNNIMKSALCYLNHNEGRVLDYLKSIKPLFPRFLSEYLSGTYLGIVQVNCKQSRVFARCLNDMFVGLQIWACSSSKADKLRWESWGEPVYGATVPHPIEVLSRPIRQGTTCPPCQDYPPTSYYVSILVPHGLTYYKTTRGPYKAYLGSKTSETTSVLRPWEREAKVPLIKRAVKLRSAIGWFVDGIIQNLESITGECWENKIEGSKRTGSALHRFSCSRQSSAGYAAMSPSKLTWMCLTTDTLSILNSINHDFMHQSLLIYVQATIAEVMDGHPEQGCAASLL
uniref:RdRp catalytic domain-containing protein n=1 Tax=Timema tahoe TaxID=61484 RepID=A0A7R9ITI1_9NEOP|nr:unnamed protein product [Timema tahoe]